MAESVRPCRLSRNASQSGQLSRCWLMASRPASGNSPRLKAANSCSLGQSLVPMPIPSSLPVGRGSAVATVLEWFLTARTLSYNRPRVTRLFPGEEQAVSQRDRSGNLTSLSLLDRVKADDPQAWQRLVGLYTPLVCHWCARWQVTGTDADDV